MPNHRLFAIALLVIAPALAEAQFTTFIPPKNKVEDSVKAVVVVQQKVQADSVARMRLTDMKTWVDSAAGIAPTPVTAADSLAAGIPQRASTRTAIDTLPLREIPPMRNGARAPATASALPMAALAGLLAVSLGLALLRRKRPVPVKARARRRA